MEHGLCDDDDVDVVGDAESGREAKTSANRNNGDKPIEGVVFLDKEDRNVIKIPSDNITSVENVQDVPSEKVPTVNVQSSNGKFLWREFGVG